MVMDQAIYFAKFSTALYGSTFIYPDFNYPAAWIINDCFSKVSHINVWASILHTFQLSECTQV